MTSELDIIGAENRRLLQEVRELRARVAAFEASRWWRLHPRFALRRLWRGRQRVADGTERPLRPPAAATHLTEEFRAHVVARGAFSHDWFTQKIANLETVLQPLDRRPAKILELGSFEGMSACFFLWRLREAHLTCIDTFTGSPEHGVMGVERSVLEETFDRNVALVDHARVRKIVGESVEVLRELGRAGERFDLIYVDASHLALDVIVDAALAWQLLAAEGVLVFDDYEWRSPLGEDPMLVPAPAIDAFLTVIGAHAEVISKGEQAIVRRTEWESAAEASANPANEAAAGARS